MRHQYEPLSFCLNFLSLPLLLIPCFRCITLQPVREYDQKSKCRTQHALLNISGFRALLIFRRLRSQRDRIVLTIQRFVRHSIHGLRNLMIRMIGPLALIPGRLHYVNMCHPRVSSCSLILSSIFQVDLLAREDVRKPPDDMVSLA